MENSNGCRGAFIALTLVLVVVVGIVAYLLLRPPSAYDHVQEQMRIERAEALQPWNLALSITLRALLIGAGVTLILLLLRATLAGAHWLDNKSRQIYPDDAGQFPAVKVRPGEAVVDLNRLPDGKAMTGVVGGKVGILVVLAVRYLLGRDVPELTDRPAVLVQPSDTSPAQLQVTGQAQAVQALAAANRSGRPASQRTTSRVVESLAAARQQPQALPLEVRVETLAEQPRQMQLLLEAGRREWQAGEVDGQGDVVDGIVRLPFEPGD
jgi:hypothetical protein